MQGPGDTSYAYSGETTEWDDVLIRKGITTKEDVLLAKGLNPADFAEKKPAPELPVLTVEEQIDSANLDELEEYEDEFSDDRMIQKYRLKRMQELKEAAASNCFGSLSEISKNDWIPEVTEGSNKCWVVAYLYQDSVVECRVMEEALTLLARKFSSIKFVKIRSTEAIENWPSRNLPTVFIYKNGNLQHQIVTLKQFNGSVSVDDVEWWMAQNRILETELEEDPALKRTRIHRVTHRSMFEDEDDDDIE